MVLGQFSDICGPANIRKLAKDHKGYGSAATERYIYTPYACRWCWNVATNNTITLTLYSHTLYFIFSN
jgi:hypothetical protein